VTDFNSYQVGDQLARTETREVGGVVPPHPELAEYPELELVLSLAVSAVARAFALDEDADAEKVRRLERAAVTAMVSGYAPTAGSARLMAGAAEEARLQRAASVVQTARVLDVRTVAAAEVLHVRTAPVVPAPKSTATADSRARQRASAATAAAQSAQRAASQAAAAADRAAIAAEHELRSAASAVEASALYDCYQLAINAATAAAETCTGDAEPKGGQP